MKKQKIAIIGTGMSGLTVANFLKSHYDMTLFEKARGVGGRLATRYHENFCWDFGAQFFMIKDPQFKSFLNPLIKSGELKAWQAKFAEFDGKINYTKQWNITYPHWVASPKMNVLAKALAQNLKVHLNKKIISIKQQKNLWLLKTEDEETFEDFDWVVLAIPAAQAYELLPNYFLHKQAVNHIKMLGCYALMLGFSEAQTLDWQVALIKNSKLSWISNNSSKPNRKSNFSMVALSANQWAEAHIHFDLEAVKKILIEEAQKISAFNPNYLTYSTIHRWRYANLKKQKGSAAAYIDHANKLAVCGDWCIKGRVEAAFQSGKYLSQQLLRL